MEHLFNASSSSVAGGDLSGVKITDFVTESRDRAKVSPSRLPLVCSGDLVTKSPIQAAEVNSATREAQVDSSGGERFEVCLEWETQRGEYGAGVATSLPHEGGCYWFLIDSQAGVVIKVCDAGGDFADMQYSIYSRNLINVAVEMTIKDTVTGEVRVLGDLPGSMADKGIC